MERVKNIRAYPLQALIVLLLLALLLTVRVILQYSSRGYFYNLVWPQLKQIDVPFFYMVLAGFVAQLVDGAIGMGYGVTCTAILLSMGTNLPAISRSVNTAKIFSVGSSGYYHYKLGNVNKKLFRVMVIPALAGAITGAIALVKFGDEYAQYVRPLLALYAMFLGLKILLAAYKRDKRAKKLKNAGWLAAAGGFLDSFGGGGWGPLVTSTLISKGRTPRIVVGSVNVTEVFVSMASVVTFFILIGISHWEVIAGLVSGGLLAAPIAARISGKLPVKTMMIIVGSFVIFWSLFIIMRSLHP